MKLGSTLWQRGVCLFNNYAYIVQTEAPQSAVLLLLPHAYHQLNPLLQRLALTTNFNLSSHLANFKPAQTHQIQSDVLTRQSIYGMKLQPNTEVLVKDQKGRLKFTNTWEGQVLGVVLFGTLKGQNVAYMSRSYAALNELLLKLFVLVCVFKVCRALQLATRQQNFHQLDQSKK